MNVVLVNPNLDLQKLPPKINRYYPDQPIEPPLGILYLASFLLKNGIKTEVIDNALLKLNSEKLSELIVKKNPDLIGFSVHAFNWPTVLTNIHYLKKITKTPIVCGGPMCTIDPEIIIKHYEVDYLVIGEGEHTLLELINYLSSTKKESNVNLDSIKGLVFKYKNNIFINQKRELIVDIDQLPCPARQLINLNSYQRDKTNFLKLKPVDVIFASRGCPYDCTYCANKIISKSCYRFRRTESILTEINFLIENYQTKSLRFADAILTADRHKITKLCQEMINSKLNLPWQCHVHVNNLDNDLLRLMSNAGCRGIWFGIESISQSLQKAIHKNIPVEKIREVVYLCKKYNIYTSASFMMGFPNETKEEIQMNVQLAKKLNFNLTYFSPLVAMPNTDIYNTIKEKKLYDFEWNNLLLARNKNYSSDEIYNLAKFYNIYFKFRQLVFHISTAPSKDFFYAPIKFFNYLTFIFKYKILKIYYIFKK
ncbi:B12-binding domain-containing radical SAM protein [Patescibacteria group bacterium]|nr:B12-binding domain-containing radical SAM protein [Patescibacteria group bacterium]